MPLNVIGDLEAPENPAEEETLRDEIEGLVSGLLGLVGIESDPLSGREHILLANLIHRSWSEGNDLDLAAFWPRCRIHPCASWG